MDPKQQIRDVYVASSARLVAQLYAVTGSHAEAQDSVQEAFARALARPGRFAALKNPEAWLRTVALNVARSQHRRRRFLAGLIRSGRLAGPEQNGPALSPDHVALVAALQKLSGATREAVVLHYIGDLPATEVAATLGCSVSAAKTRLVRGRQALAEHLGERPPTVLPGPNYLRGERPNA